MSTKDSPRLIYSFGVARENNIEKSQRHPPMSALTLRSSIWTETCLLSMLLLMATSACAQSCSQAELINLKLTGQSEAQKTELVRQLQHTNNPFEIYRWAAIAEWRIIPILRTLSRPAMPVNSSSGEAQVSLAKLGDKNSLSELDQELNHSADSRHAVAKLLRVGNDRTVALLIALLQQ